MFVCVCVGRGVGGGVGLMGYCLVDGFRMVESFVYMYLVFSSNFCICLGLRFCAVGGWIYM